MRRKAKEFWDAQTLLPPLASSQPSPSSPLPPFLSQETPSGFEWKPDLSSLACMLRWDVPASLSCSLYSHFIPKHKYYLPHVFVCLSLPLFSRTLTRSLFLRPSPSMFLPLNPHPPPPPRGPQWTIRGPMM